MLFELDWFYVFLCAGKLGNSYSTKQATVNNKILRRKCRENFGFVRSKQTGVCGLIKADDNFSFRLPEIFTQIPSGKVSGASSSCVQFETLSSG